MSTINKEELNQLQRFHRKAQELRAEYNQLGLGEKLIKLSLVGKHKMKKHLKHLYLINDV
jgi:hypothetical protein